MEYTTNYNLKKPGDNDNVLVSDLNENMDKVDSTLKDLSDGKANLDPGTGKVPETELPEFLKLAGGTMKGIIQMANFLIKGLPTPQAGGDAARKQYVDDQVATRAKLAVGTYRGTHTKSLRLTFGFHPKALIIFKSERVEEFYNGIAVYAGQSSDTYSVYGNDYTRYYNPDSSGITITSGGNYSEGFCMNDSFNYCYVAFG